MNTNQNVPAGKYDCWLTMPLGEDGAANGEPQFDITTDRQGVLSISVGLELAAPDGEEAFAHIDKEMCIDADAKPWGAATTTPYEFTALELTALGADRDKLDTAIIEGLASEEQKVQFVGQSRRATAEISYKAGAKGGQFMQVRIMAKRAVTDDAKAKAIEALKARMAANKPQPNPFEPKPGSGSPMPAPAPKEKGKGKK